MAATRERLVNAALALFARQGIYDTTVEDITEAADVGKGTFYQHFPSKNAIIRHLLHEGFSDLLEQCRREARAASTAAERVQCLLRVQFQFFNKRRDLLILFHQVRGWLKLHTDEGRSLQKEYERYIRFLASELGTSLDERQWSRATLRQMACAMAGLVTGYLSYLVISGVRQDDAGVLDIPIRIFLEGIVGDTGHGVAYKGKVSSARGGGAKARLAATSEGVER
ncbi:HTH-type transcriptional repressor KstR2 [Candidatus Methylomirabilis lanthanidiphila]|uniref:HTH-type transcriptional repressor KstR2 n=1 Tax=Candidatus Methylomirabilis lanthanidiphila TaxID=2211376 RepID=A0A564ZFX4_9BACT|nr:TetR/AcrR family transcriptional regulator [Candidatus Methylomirabilis lanthanidiphila]VUZ84184.1 HTH-type transcriptional repressor KstR2 [Candidatus Methylomirabilis lanthanidiphila]